MKGSFRRMRGSRRGQDRASARRAPLLFAAAVALTSSVPLGVVAQMPGMIPADPDMPTIEGFDADRAIFWERRNFDPLRDPEWTSLAGARRAGNVADDTPVVVFEAGGETLVLVSSQMSYHHVAQGEMAGEPWMVTF